MSHHFQRSLDPAQMKLGINETCERIKEEFNFIQSQYHSLKMECEKLAQEKTEMQRHYVMVSNDELYQIMKPAPSQQFFNHSCAHVTCSLTGIVN